MSGDLHQRVRRAGLVWMIGMSAAMAALLLARELDVGGVDASPWPIFLATLVVTAGVLLNAWTLASRDSRIVTEMAAAAREMTRGDEVRQIDLKRIPLSELRELAEAINALSIRTTSDIAEMKRLERVRSEFLGNVSHELRTPIFSVQGYLETLIDGAIDDPAVREEFLHKAHQNVLRLHNLLADLIEISRIESGEMKMSFRYFDAADYFRGVVEELRPTAEMAGVRLEYRVIGSDDDNSALGDRERLKQVVVNLVENAIKYNRPDGAVSVEIDYHDSEAIVTVRDTGIGISSEDIRRIFERFYRVDKVRSRSIGGSGLGLAIAKHIIEAHRSRITVESTPGIGSTFSFSLKR